MEFSSIVDILKFALSKEEASVQFYRDLAAQMKQASTRSLFEVLVRHELKHVDSLRFEIEKMGYTVDTTSDELDSTYRWEERLDMDEEAHKMHFIEALEVAIQKERAAFRLYAQMIGTTKEERFEKVLMELAEEEMRHVLQFEREYETVTHHKE